MKHDVGDRAWRARRGAASPPRLTDLRSAVAAPVRTEDEVLWPDVRGARWLAWQVEALPIVVRAGDLLAGDWRPSREPAELPLEAKAALDWPGLLGLGLDGFARLLERRRGEIRLLDPGRPEKLAWQDAAELALRAVRRWIERHAEQAAARTAAEPGEPNPLARQCAALLTGPPTELAEALQLLWSALLCLAIESDGDGPIPSLGRLDSLLAPYLQDAGAPDPILTDFLGRLASLDPAAELLLGPEPTSAAFAVLAAATACGGAAPALALLWREDESDGLLRAATAAVEAGCTVRVLDEPGLADQLHRVQIATRHAHDAFMHEGGEASVVGRSAVWLAGPPLRLDPILDEVLRDGAGPETYDALLDAFGQRLEANAHELIAAGIERQAIAERRQARPWRSLLTQGCLESSRDLSRGGALYSFLLVRATGIADAAARLERLQFGSGEPTAEVAELRGGPPAETPASPGWRALLGVLWSDAVAGCRDRFGGAVLAGLDPPPTLTLDIDATAELGPAIASALAEGEAVRLVVRQDIGAGRTTDPARSGTGD